MAHSQKWLAETTTGKMFVLLFLFLFLSLGAAVSYDTSSSSNSEESPSSLDDFFRDAAKRSPPSSSSASSSSGVNNVLSYYKRYGSLDDEVAKRALSLLARWRPQALVGMPKVNTRSDVLSAVTRGGHARPLGQPLRWG